MVYLVTEYVEPLQINLNQYVANDAQSRQQKDLFIAWGIFQTTVIKLSKFIHVQQPLNMVLYTFLLACLKLFKQ
jgi:hypothetical protein